MGKFNLASKRALFQTVCFGFIATVAISGNFFAYPSSEIRDTGGMHGTAKLSTIEHTNETTVPAVAKTYAGAPTPKTTNQNGNTLIFNQPVTNVANTSNKFCTEYDAGNGIIHCTSYGGKFYYAHNNRAFSNLKNAKVGSRIIIGGQTYQVTYLTTIDYNTAANNMGSILSASYGGQKSDISLMTCAGNYSSALGTNTHRLIVLANRV